MNIEEYKFSDPCVTAQIEGDELWLVAVAYSSLKKRDAIEIARHFQLTADDIKE
jgi:hypothetical protein